MVLSAITSSNDGRWADPIAVARRTVDELLGLWEEDPMTVRRGAGELRSCRSDDAMLLAVAEAGLDPLPDKALEAMGHRLDGATFELGLVARLANVSRLGVVSMGAATRGLLEALTDPHGVVSLIVTDSSAVARGLGYLPSTSISIGDPTGFGVLLVPGVASFGPTVWTPEPVADLATRARVAGHRIVPVVHPVAVLNTVTVDWYRPPSGVVQLAVT